MLTRPKKSDKRKRPKKTPAEIEEEQSRTLYVRLPHTIKSVDEVKDLFFGDFRVKKPRQSSRHCHVIFSDLEGKIKNFKAVKDKKIGEKPIYVGPPRPMNLNKKKSQQKKIKIPAPKTPEKINKYLFISNIPPGVKASEVKDAFPGAKTVALLKGLVDGKRLAKLKMSSTRLCSHYVNNKANWPVIKDQKVCVKMSKNTDKKKKLNSKSKKNQSKTKDSTNGPTKKSQEDDDSEEEDTDEEDEVVKEEEEDESEEFEEEEEDEDDEEEDEDESEEEDDDEEEEEESSSEEE